MPPLNITSNPSAPGQVGSRSTFRIRGMNCAGCVGHVTQALQTVPGVAAAQVDLAAARAKVEWRAGAPVDTAQAMAAVARVGFAAELDEGSGAPAAGAGSSWWIQGWAGAIVMITLMALEWGAGVGQARWYHWLSFALALPIQFWGGARFYRGAWQQLKAGSANMDALVALGSTTAFAASTWMLLALPPTHLFFMESVSIITLISVGHAIEARVTRRANQSLEALLQLEPSSARRVNASGEEEVCSLDQLVLGDVVVLRPGERVPVDGEVIAGTTAIDESMLTGESMPVAKSAGARVYSGTSNQSGLIQVRISALGAETALARIVEFVQRAQNSRAEIQKLGDAVSRVFVPVVILLAVVTALGWGLAGDSLRSWSAALGLHYWGAHSPAGNWVAAIYHAAAVLIVACPCAMGLATPVALMAGTGVAAERGILMRDAAALEKSGRITAVVFDKTGTLTEGRVQVAATHTFRGSPRESAEVVAVAASLAQGSNHPLSRALTGLSTQRVPIRDWRELPGMGIEGHAPKMGDAAGTTSPPPTSNDNELARWRLGSIAWLREQHVDLAEADEILARETETGATMVGLACGESLVAAFTLRDVLKPNAAAVLTQLRHEGKRIYLMTGDRPEVAQSLAQPLGLDPSEIMASVRPEDKAGHVARLQREGARVAFVGDGINDAPALEQADLGIAVAQASDVAKDAADMLLLRSDIEAVPLALALAQATLRTIRQNLFWAFFYNAAAVPLAMMGLFSPIVSAVAMGLSDLMVIGNALRLRRWRQRRETVA